MNPVIDGGVLVELCDREMKIQKSKVGQSGALLMKLTNGLL